MAAVETRWNNEKADDVVGVPWEPIPGGPGQIEFKVRVILLYEEGAILKGPQAEAGEGIVTRTKLFREDVMNH
jgi:hypothetical protein